MKFTLQALSYLLALFYTQAASLRSLEDPCEGLTITQTIKDKGINPDQEILYNSTRISWNDVCTVVKAWNEKFPNKPFLLEDDLNNNLLTVSALFGNAAEESDHYLACAEYVTPCPDPSKCSGGAVTDYEDDKWGTCYQVPVVSGGTFEMTGVLPANACGTTPSCTATNGNSYTGTDCWYGRGALQLTWDCNYAKANVLIGELGLGINVCNTPDSVCSDGKTFFATSLAYWMMTVEDVFQEDHRMDTAMNCVKSGCDAPYSGTWTGSGAETRRAEFNRLTQLLGATPNP